MENYEVNEGIEEEVTEEEKTEKDFVPVSESETSIDYYPEENNHNLIKAGIGLAVAGGIATAFALRFHPVKKIKEKIATRKEEENDRIANLAAEKVLEVLEELKTSEETAETEECTCEELDEN